MMYGRAILFTWVLDGEMPCFVHKVLFKRGLGKFLEERFHDRLQAMIYICNSRVLEIGYLECQVQVSGNKIQVSCSGPPEMQEATAQWLKITGLGIWCALWSPGDHWQSSPWLGKRECFQT